MDAETYTLAPSIVVDKARRLHEAGLHEQALAMLTRNQVVVDVYPTHVEMRLAREMDNKRAQDKFVKGWRIGRHLRERKRKN